MDAYRIEIVGAGVVGTATGSAFADWGHDVVYKELRRDRREELTGEGKQVVRPETPVEADLSVVAVPTPFDPDEGLVTSHVEAAVDLLAETASKERVVVVRSTVPPGTTERLGASYGFEHVAMVPEFLFAATATADAHAVDEVVVGAASERARETVEGVFAPRDPTVFVVRPAEAELVKLASNAYGATKISFANETWRVGDAVPGVDQNRLLEVFRRVSPWVGNTRGLAGGRPYGGACLPKDTKGYRAWLRERDVAAPQLEGTIDENELMLERDREALTYGRP